jgi:adenosine deaminase
MQHSSDVHRVTYEALGIAAAAGVRYREMFFSPTFLLRHGVAFDDIWDGIAAGVRDAAVDHGIACRMILDVDKPSGPGPARELVELAAGCDRDVLIGIGGDAGETDIDLAAFAAPFDLARSLGFRTTMHLGEEARSATSGRAWRRWASSASTTASASSTTRRWWRGWPSRARG